MNDPKHIGDGVAVFVAFGAVVQWLPPLAAAASLIWIVFQWWHHPATKAWRARYFNRNRKEA